MVLHPLNLHFKSPLQHLSFIGKALIKCTTPPTFIWHFFKILTISLKPLSRFKTMNSPPSILGRPAVSLCSTLPEMEELRHAGRAVGSRCRPLEAAEARCRRMGEGGWLGAGKLSTFALQKREVEGKGMIIFDKIPKANLRSYVQA